MRALANSTKEIKNMKNTLSLILTMLSACYSFAYVDVTDSNYGADGADLVDDTAAIQSAIDAAYAQYLSINGASYGNEILENSFGTTVYIPSGVYYISDTLDLPIGVSLKGETSLSTILFFDVGTSSAIELTGDPSNKIYPSSNPDADRRLGNSISSLRVQSKLNTTYQADHLITSPTTTWWLTIDDVFLFGSNGAAIELAEVVYVNITNCDIEPRGGECITLLGGTTVNIDRCYLHRSGPGKHVVHAAGIHGLKITNSILESAGGNGSTEAFGIYMNDVNGGYISGNYFEDNSYWDIYTTSDEPTETSSTTTIIGNYFNSSSSKKPIAHIETESGNYGIAYMQRGRHNFISNLIPHNDQSVVFIQEQEAFDSLLLQSNSRLIDLIVVDQDGDELDLKYGSKNVAVDLVSDNSFYLGGTNTAYGRAIKLRGQGGDNVLLTLLNRYGGGSGFRSKIDFNFGDEETNLTQIVATGKSVDSGDERGWGEINTMARGKREPVICWQDRYGGKN